MVFSVFLGGLDILIAPKCDANANKVPGPGLGSHSHNNNIDSAMQRGDVQAGTHRAPGTECKISSEHEHGRVSIVSLCVCV